MKRTTHALNLKTNGGENKMKTMVKILLVLVAVIGIIGVQSANAVPTLTLKSGATTVSIVDEGLGDITAGVGAMTYSGVVGNFIVNVSTGVTKPILGSAIQPWMDLNTVNVSSGPGVIEIWFDDTGFTYTGGIIMRAGGTFQNTVTYEAQKNDVAFATATLLSGAASVTTGGSTSLIATDKLTLYTKFTHTAAGGSSGDLEILTPEPSTLILLGSGLVGVFFAGRRMKK